MSTPNTLLPDGRNLRLTFAVDSSELSSTDFVSLFEAIDEICKGIVEGERYALLEDLGLSSEFRVAFATETRKIARRLPAPANVLEVKRGSWVVQVLIPAAAIIGTLGTLTLKSTLFPAMSEAFNQSRGRETIIRFLREKAFGGARRSAEMIASDLSGGGQLRVRGVHEKGDSPHGRRELEISVEVTRVIRVRVSER